MERKLTTIFASDVVGFSKMMGEDEVNTLKILNLVHLFLKGFPRVIYIAFVSIYFFISFGF